MIVYLTASFVIKVQNLHLLQGKWKFDSCEISVAVSAHTSGNSTSEANQGLWIAAYSSSPLLFTLPTSPTDFALKLSSNGHCLKTFRTVKFSVALLAFVTPPPLLVSFSFLFFRLLFVLGMWCPLFWEAYQCTLWARSALVYITVVLIVTTML